MNRLIAAGALLVALGSCSFTTATGFQDCTINAQCGATGACISNYCVPMPPRCFRAEGEFDAPNSIKVMALLPIGEGPTLDNSEVQGLNALNLAVLEANKATGIRGRQFGLYACNTYGEDERTITQTKFAVSQLQVAAIISSGSGQTQVIASVKERRDAKTLVVSPTATSPQLEAAYTDDKSVWRIPPSDASQARVMRRLITEPSLDAGVTYSPTGGIAVLFEDTAYGNSFANALLSELSTVNRAPTLVPFTKSTTVTDANAKTASLSTASNGSAPKTTVFIGLPTDLKTMVSSIVSTQPTLRRSQGHQWLLSDGVKDPVIIDAVTRSELLNTIGTTPSQASGINYQFFKGQFQAKFNTDPENYSFIPHGYDAMYVVMLAAAWASQTPAGVTGATMAEGMTKLSAMGTTAIPLNATTWSEASNKLSSGTAIDIDGTSGSLNFDLATGAPPAPYDVWQALDGGFRINQTLNP